MLQTSEISPFIYKNNVIRRLKFYWLIYKSRRSAVSGQRSAVSGQRSAVTLPIPVPLLIPAPLLIPVPLLIPPLANQPRAPLIPSCAPDPQTVADTRRLVLLYFRDRPYVPYPHDLSPRDFGLCSKMPTGFPSLILLVP